MKQNLSGDKIDNNLKSEISEATKLAMYLKGNEKQCVQVAADGCIVHFNIGDVVCAWVIPIAVVYGLMWGIHEYSHDVLALYSRWFGGYIWGEKNKWI